MYYKKIKTLFTLTLLLLLLTIPTNSLAETQEPWQAKKNEFSLQGLYLGYKHNLIQIKINDKLINYSFSPDAIFALMGLHSGKLVSLPQFPREIHVQIILDSTGRIRAMRNKPEQLEFIPGTVLESWGHLATLSPNQKYYTLFNLWEGLFLHDLEEENHLPFFLSPQPLCTWNNQGTELAYADHLCLEIFNPQKNIKKTYPFPQNNLGTVRVVTSIAWSPQDDKLCYAYLEDYPQQGSDFFQIIILDENGKELAAKTIENLGPLCWLSEEIILIVVNPTEQETGKIILWNYQTDKTTFFIEKLEGLCNNLCFNQHSSSLAYTIAENENGQEELYLYTLAHKKTRKLKSFVSPLHNLQWLKDNQLIFWEEFNNSIIIIKETGEVSKKSTGFLPEKSAAEKFLYFPEEPREEPLPLYLSP